MKNFGDWIVIVFILGGVILIISSIIGYALGEKQKFVDGVDHYEWRDEMR